MSDENPTVRLPQEEIQVGLLNKLVDGVAGLRNDMHELKADIGLVSNDLKNTKEDLRITKEGMVARFEKLETRADTNSMRAQEPSAQDLETASQLAQERAAREDLAKQVGALTLVNKQQLQILTDVHASAKKLLERPEVKWLAAALWMAFTAWLATKGIK